MALAEYLMSSEVERIITECLQTERSAMTVVAPGSATESAGIRAMRELAAQRRAQQSRTTPFQEYHNKYALQIQILSQFLALKPHLRFEIKMMLKNYFVMDDSVHAEAELHNLIMFQIITSTDAHIFRILHTTYFRPFIAGYIALQYFPQTTA